MHRRTQRTRRTLITSLLASSVALGGAAFLAPTAAAAVPAASCTVTPAANGMSVTITGEGFTAPRKLNDGESTQDLNVDASGNFKLTRFQKNVDYTVLAVNEDQPFVFVNCKRVAAPGTTTPQPTPNATPQNNRRDYQQGFQAGFRAGQEAGRANCDVRPQVDKSSDHSAAYWNGYTAGAARGFDRVC
ncbi:hypothetical protein [Streptomyces sp. NPDC058701]|uniref:hypothetical protein n=1 Tax=Streptomyces sp. NPDC058701 TaxID=3346608 RepID=UPI003663D712